MFMMIEIKELRPEEIVRIAEIDRSEHVTKGYKVKSGRLVAEAVDWNVPRWPKEGSDDFSIQGMLKFLRPILNSGGILLGALEGDRFAGLAVLRPHLEEEIAQLAALFVSKDYRRRGIARQLTEEAIRLSRETGAHQLYVSATPSESAVGFYLSQGFKLAKRVHPELYELEPEDIHLILDL